MLTEYDLRKSYGDNDAKMAEWALATALNPQLGNEEWDLTDKSPIEKPLFWPSTIKKLDMATRGGFYGMTVLSATKGTGKTMLARSSAIEAAASGKWQVVHFLAEDDWYGWRDGFNVYLTQHEHARECLPYYHVEQVGRNQTPESLSLTALHHIDLELDRPLLIVLDSVNSIVNLSNANYLSGLKEWGIFCMLSRRLSRGRVSWMITSEANKSGNAKGEGLPYWADVHLKLKKVKGVVVEMDLDKTRRTGGEGDLGKFQRNVGRGLFLTDEELNGYRPLRIVNGDDAGWDDEERHRL